MPPPRCARPTRRVRTFPSSTQRAPSRPAWPRSRCARAIASGSRRCRAAASRCCRRPAARAIAMPSCSPCSASRPTANGRRRRMLRPLWERLDPGALLLSISDGFDEGLPRLLERLAATRREVLSIQVLSTEERDFPFRGGQLFREPETGAERRADPVAVRDEFLARFASRAPGAGRAPGRGRHPPRRVRARPAARPAAATLLRAAARRGRERVNLAFLAPAALAALAALLVPLLIHLQRRPEQRVVEFAALRWLSERVRPRQRLRLTELLLLLLRLLLVAALALWLAQPVWLDYLPRARAWELVVPGIDPGDPACTDRRAGAGAALARPGFSGDRYAAAAGASSGGEPAARSRHAPAAGRGRGGVGAARTGRTRCRAHPPVAHRRLARGRRGARGAGRAGRRHTRDRGRDSPRRCRRAGAALPRGRGRGLECGRARPLSRRTRRRPDVAVPADADWLVWIGAEPPAAESSTGCARAAMRSCFRPSSQEAAPVAPPVPTAAIERRSIGRGQLASRARCRCARNRGRRCSTPEFPSILRELLQGEPARTRSRRCPGRAPGGRWRAPAAAGVPGRRLAGAGDRAAAAGRTPAGHAHGLARAGMNPGMDAIAGLQRAARRRGVAIGLARWLPGWLAALLVARRTRGHHGSDRGGRARRRARWRSCSCATGAGSTRRGWRGGSMRGGATSTTVPRCCTPPRNRWRRWSSCSANACGSASPPAATSTCAKRIRWRAIALGLVLAGIAVVAASWWSVRAPSPRSRTDDVAATPCRGRPHARSCASHWKSSRRPTPASPRAAPARSPPPSRAAAAWPGTSSWRPRPPPRDWFSTTARNCPCSARASAGAARARSMRPRSIASRSKAARRSKPTRCTGSRRSRTARPNCACSSPIAP